MQYLTSNSYRRSKKHSLKVFPRIIAGGDFFSYQKGAIIRGKAIILDIAH